MTRTTDVALVDGRFRPDRTRRVRVAARPPAPRSLKRGVSARIKQEFDAEGIEIPFPQRAVWHRGDSDYAEAGTGSHAGR